MSDARTSVPTDETLARAAKGGENGALSALITRYTPYIRKRAQSAPLVGMDADDIVQEGLLGLFHAIRSYDETKGASFRTFAFLCINRQLLKVQRSVARQKHAPLNNYLPFYEDGQPVDPSLTQQSAEDIIISGEQLAAVRQSIEKQLTSLESRVLSLYLSGYSYTQISQKLGVKAKSVDNAMQRIRRKLKSVALDIRFLS